MAKTAAAWFHVKGKAPVKTKSMFGDFKKKRKKNHRN